jgi:hypothetical protein
MENESEGRIQKLQLMLSGYQQKTTQLDMLLMDARADVTLLEEKIRERDGQLGEMKGLLEQAKVQLDLAQNPPGEKETNQQFAKRRQAEAKAKLVEAAEPEPETKAG